MSAYSLVLLSVGMVIGWFTATCFWSLYAASCRARQEDEKQSCESDAPAATDQWRSTVEA